MAILLFAFGKKIILYTHYNGKKMLPLHFMTCIINNDDEYEKTTYNNMPAYSSNRC